MESSPLVVVVTYTRQDLNRLARTTLFRTRLVKWTLALFVVLLAFLLARGAVVAALVAVVLAAPGLAIVFARTGHRVARSNPTLLAERSICLGDAGVDITTDATSTHIDWEGLEALFETSDLYMIKLRHSAQRVLLPKRCLEPGQQAALLSILAEHHIEQAQPVHDGRTVAVWAAVIVVVLAAGSIVHYATEKHGVAAACASPSDVAWKPSPTAQIMVVATFNAKVTAHQALLYMEGPLVDAAGHCMLFPSIQESRPVVLRVVGSPAQRRYEPFIASVLTGSGLFAHVVAGKGRFWTS